MNAFDGALDGVGRTQARINLEHVRSEGADPTM
jgi:hypothetical protein